MALENSDRLYPDQWRRLTQGSDKDQAWGNPQPPRTSLNGKTAEEIRGWAANCKAKIAFFLGKIPERQEDNDGFWEVRGYLMRLKQRLEPGRW